MSVPAAVVAGDGSGVGELPDDVDELAVELLGNPDQHTQGPVGGELVPPFDNAPVVGAVTSTDTGQGEG